jgi:hypothetical protein
MSRVVRGTSQLVPVEELKEGTYSADPTISYDGTKIAYPSFDQGAQKKIPERDPLTFRETIVNPNQITVLDLTTRKKTVVAFPGDGFLYRDIRWTRDSQGLVFLTQTIGENNLTHYAGLDYLTLPTATSSSRLVRLVSFSPSDPELYTVVDVAPKNDVVVFGSVQPFTMTYLASRLYNGILKEVRTVPLAASTSLILSARAASTTPDGIHPLRSVSRTLVSPAAQEEGAPTLQLRTFTPKEEEPSQVAIRHTESPTRSPAPSNRPDLPPCEQFATPPYRSLQEEQNALLKRKQEILMEVEDVFALADHQEYQQIETRLAEMEALRAGTDKCYGTPLYLYPQGPAGVGVRVKVGRPVFNSNLPYQDGWNVVALPNGTMITTAGLLDKITYDYAAPVTIPSEGYVVPRDKLTDLLTRYATTLGLTERESADFISHWEKTVPTTYPYIFVSHYQGKDAQEILPLAIEPKPDTLLQVVMVFKPLSTPPSLSPTLPPIHPFPPRTGFTAVEWSGVVIDK